MEAVRVGGYYGTLVVSLSVVARLRSLHERRLVRIEWLTSWEDDANSELAPRIGLGPFPVHVEPDQQRGPTYWKEAVVRSHAASRPQFIWVDDEMTMYDAHTRVASDFPSSLVIAPDSRMGLTHAHLDAIEAYAAGI